MRQTAFRILLVLFVASVAMISCNNKSKETKTESDTTQTMPPDTTKTMPDTTKAKDTSLQGKPVDEGDTPQP